MRPGEGVWCQPRILFPEASSAHSQYWKNRGQDIEATWGSITAAEVRSPAAPDFLPHTSR